jgi:hypothetical protein
VKKWPKIAFVAVFLLAMAVAIHFWGARLIEFAVDNDKIVDPLKKLLELVALIGGLTLPVIKWLIGKSPFPGSPPTVADSPPMRNWKRHGHRIVVYAAYAWKRHRRRILVYGAYAILMCLAVGLEHSDELFGSEQCDRFTIAGRMWYQRISLLGYRRPRAHFVRLITLPPVFDKCPRREFLAALLQRLKTIHPAMVVLDYAYPTTTPCIETVKLKQALAELADTTPIIVGRSSETQGELEYRKAPNLEELENYGFSKADQILKQDDISDGAMSCTSPMSAESGANSGLIRLDCDTRRVPLHWSVYRNSECVKQKAKVQEPTLSFAAASTWDVDLGTLLKPMLDAEDHPFISFLSEKEFKPVDAINLVCGRRISSWEDWHQCGRMVDNDFGLRGRIVLIGEHSRSDIHQSVIGNVPGVVLQANYLESLLDDRYLKPMGRRLEALLTLFSLVVVAVIFEVSSGPLIGLLRAVMFVSILVLISYIALVQAGYFFAFWIPSAGAIVISLIDRIRDKIHRDKIQSKGRMTMQHDNIYHPPQGPTADPGNLGGVESRAAQVEEAGPGEQGGVESVLRNVASVGGTDAKLIENI